MRKIVSLSTSKNFLLHLVFDNGSKKVFDFKPYLLLPVFSALTQSEEFNKVINKGYFIEWPLLEADLSADTLWHESK